MIQSWNQRTRRVFSVDCRSKQILVGWMLIAVCISAQAVGPTGEEESLADFNSGLHPLSISPDGEWRVHVDEHGVLHRVNLANPDDFGQIAIPAVVKAISVSSAASKVAITDGGCLGVVTFTRKSDSKAATSNSSEANLRWLQVEGMSKPADCSYLSKPTQDSDAGVQQGARHYGAFSVALSRDGNYVAVSGRTIRIVEVDSGRVAFKVPTGAAHILHTRFIDNDRKLLVVQAILGEQWESPAEGSDMQFAVWDLQSKTLFSFHNTQTTGTLTPYDFLWSFSDKTGELWAINTSGQYWKAAGKRMPIRPYSINLKQCNSVRKRELSLPSGQGWLGFVADPQGRWVAVATSPRLE